MLAEVDAFADWLAEGAADEASWRGLGAAHQCGRELWGVPLTVEMHYGDGFTSVMVCGVSRFGAWEVSDSYAVAEASDEFDAGAWAFVGCVRQLMDQGDHCGRHTLHQLRPYRVPWCGWRGSVHLRTPSAA